MRRELPNLKFGARDDLRLPSAANSVRAVSVADAAALALLLLVLGTLAGASLSWLVLGHLSGLPAFVCGIGLALVACRFALEDREQLLRIRASLVVVAGLGLSVAPNLVVHDFSYDGQQYHQEAVSALADGWNPLGPQPFTGVHELWINAYAKGPWTWSAVWAQLTGSLEAGKSLHLLLGAAAALSVYGALRHALCIERRLSAWLAILAALNPVLAYQWATHMNDSLLGSLLLVALSRGLVIAAVPEARSSRSKAVTLLMLAAATALLAATKSSGLAYGILLGATGVMVCVLARRWSSLREVVVATSAGLIFGVLVIGWNPYVTNTLRHGHPLYPLAGSEKVDIISGNSPRGVVAAGQFSQLFGSAFSRSHSYLAPVRPRSWADCTGASAALPEDPNSQRMPAIRPKWPGSMELAELKVFSVRSDVRIGGFGPWFSLALVLALAAFMLAVARGGLRGRGLGLALLVPGTVLLLSLVFPEPWWARYVPQLALLPIALAAGAMLGSGLQWVRRLGGAALVVVSVNALLVTGLFAAGVAVRELDARTQLASLAALSSPEKPLPVLMCLEPALASRLQSFGVHTRAGSVKESCTRWVTLHHSGVLLCLPADSESGYREESPLVSRMKSALGL